MHSIRYKKSPIILPRNHRATKLLIKHYHEDMHHANGETVVNEIRQKYSIPRLRATLRSITKDSQFCKIRKATPCIPRMAPLPPARLAVGFRPFTHVGLDYFGHMTVKVGRSAVKRWVALFTCLTIRAVHLEVAHNLTTESCIACVRRFICRRGAPSVIYSDNGTNFKGAKAILEQQLAPINRELSISFTNTDTQWNGIPSATPHMGGAWERMVRSVKEAMRSIACAEMKNLNDEGLLTLVGEAKNIVNSRPLTYLPLDSEESEALTPNHFLLGSSSGSKPLLDHDCTYPVRIKGSWELIQTQTNQFWRRWVIEFLPVITRRTKWFNETKPIELGNIVFIVDEKRRNKWLREKVIEIRKGWDGRIRQAVVETHIMGTHITKIPKTPPISCTKNPVPSNKAKKLSVWWVKPHDHRSSNFNVVEISFLCTGNLFAQHVSPVLKFYLIVQRKQKKSVCLSWFVVKHSCVICEYVCLFTCE
ncbi:uncharacterized protein LOC120904045 [Anopheles arabiensis]|uniref:uncharacterized protein LOC120904045 n=1 Tax=Anopheles arabiensis TaxID=7173 RepID=UPI001AAC71EE|nr:uncharacterized protein LOC120904045 [Anopheles arabiensis]